MDWPMDRRARPTPLPGSGLLPPAPRNVPWTLCPNLPEKIQHTVERNVQQVWLLPWVPWSLDTLSFFTLGPSEQDLIRVGIKWCLWEGRRERGWEERRREERKEERRKRGVGKGRSAMSYEIRSLRWGIASAPRSQWPAQDLAWLTGIGWLSEWMNGPKNEASSLLTWVSSESLPSLSWPPRIWPLVCLHPVSSSRSFLLKWTGPLIHLPIPSFIHSFNKC